MCESKFEWSVTVFSLSFCLRSSVFTVFAERQRTGRVSARGGQVSQSVSYFTVPPRAAAPRSDELPTTHIPRPRGASRDQDHSITRRSPNLIFVMHVHIAMRTGTHGTIDVRLHVTHDLTNDPTVCGSNWYRRGRCCTERHTYTTTQDTLVGDRSGSAQAKSITTRPSVQLAPARVRVRFDATTVRSAGPWPILGPSVSPSRRACTGLAPLFLCAPPALQRASYRAHYIPSILSSTSAYSWRRRSRLSSVVSQ